MSQKKFLATVLAALVTVSGCAAPRYNAVFDAHATAPYRLAAGDRLRVIVFGQDALSNSYAVDGTGQISMPLVGLVNVYGMSTQEAEKAVEGRLRGRFLREPRVSVEVEAYRPFFVMGEVTTAGQYPYINGMTVQNAVAVSGGFTPRAQRSWVRLTRVIDGAPVTAEVPLTQPILPGDTISVPERFF